MQWIKRNLFFVVGGVVALALMGAAGWFVYTNIQKDREIQEGEDGLQKQVSEAQRLSTAPASPTEENIKAAKEETRRLKEFRTSLKELFAPAPVFPKTDDKGFKDFLEKNISELTMAASNANVLLPVGPNNEKFGFTFSTHRNQFQFSPGSIEPWMEQLSDIRSIAQILFQSKVNALDTIQRVAVSKDDTAPSDFLAGTILTNQAGTTFAPYLTSFRCFSADLASVIEKFSRSTNCIIVKTVNVVPSAVPLPTGNLNQPAPARRYFAPQPQAVVRPAEDYAVERRYGKGGPAPAVPQPTQVAPRTAAAATPSAVTVLTEKLLQVTLLLEVVRLHEPAPTK
jgi:hypothetical protein